METNQFDNQSNIDANKTEVKEMRSRPFDFSGAPTTNGKYHSVAGQSFILEQPVGQDTPASITQVAPEPVASNSELFLTVVVPAYNEALRLRDTLDQMLKWLESQTFYSEVVVVDDGSADETAAIVQRLMQERQNSHSSTTLNTNNHAEQELRCRLRLVENPHRGKGYAVRSGMLEGQGKFIMFSDADLCTPISETNKLLFWLDQGFDVVIGSREGIGAQRHGEPAYRHFMGRVFNLMVRVVTNSPFQDTQCGFKAFNQKAARDLFRHVQLYADNSRPVQGAMVTGFDVEVLFLALKRNYRVKEVPVEWYHVKGSKVNPIKDSLRMIRDIASVRLNDIRGVYKA